MSDLLIPDIREDKLPAWVRSTLIELRNKLNEAQGVIAIARCDAAKNGCTGKVIADSLISSKGFPLHDRARVRFHLPGGHVDVMLRENGTLLDINASGAMLILPRASNDAHVRIDGHD
jgi:hypothetical protein